MDLFTSSTFHYSCTPDSQARETDAFAVPTWKNLNYAFLPYPLLAKCLHKIQEKNITVILVAPANASKPWRDGVETMRVGQTISLGSTKTMYLPRPSKTICQKGYLMACSVRG